MSAASSCASQRLSVDLDLNNPKTYFAGNVLIGRIERHRLAVKGSEREGSTCDRERAGQKWKSEQHESNRLSSCVLCIKASESTRHRNFFSIRQSRLGVIMSARKNVYGLGHNVEMILTIVHHIMSSIIQIISSMDTNSVNSVCRAVAFNTNGYLP